VRAQAELEHEEIGSQNPDATRQTALDRPKGHYVRMESSQNQESRSGVRNQVTGIRGQKSELRMRGPPHSVSGGAMDKDCPRKTLKFRRITTTPSTAQVLERWSCGYRPDVAPPILWTTGQRLEHVDANAYFQRVLERSAVVQPCWPTGQRISYGCLPRRGPRRLRQAWCTLPAQRNAVAA
jgi:hypothetical protein